MDKKKALLFATSALLFAVSGAAIITNSFFGISSFAFADNNYSPDNYQIVLDYHSRHGGGALPLSLNKCLSTACNTVHVSPASMLKNSSFRPLPYALSHAII